MEYFGGFLEEFEEFLEQLQISDLELISDLNVYYNYICLFPKSIPYIHL